MFVRHLSLADFRSYPQAELALEPGVTTFVGLNGQGKTNLVEAIGYLATLGSHRVASDTPLVRHGAQQAIVRGVAVKDGHESLVELEINPGRANRARLGRSPVGRPRDVLGTVRTVLFAPEDLALVKGEPEQRRRFLDDLLVARQPRWAGVRSDVDRILKQRNALLKSAAPLLRRGRGRREENQAMARGAGEAAAIGGAAALAGGGDAAEARRSARRTLEVWNIQLAQAAAPLIYARLRLVRDLGPLLGKAYDAVSAGQSDARITYRSSLRDAVAQRIAGGEVTSLEEIHDELLAAWDAVRDSEVERGITLVGPHRDDLVLALGDLPAKGYASHGESWSFALGLKLAAFQLLRHDLRDDPVLILDDVFAELDTGRRDRLAALIADCEQVLITAAVPADVPEQLRGRMHAVSLGSLGGEPMPSDPGNAEASDG